MIYSRLLAISTVSDNLTTVTEHTDPDDPTIPEYLTEAVKNSSTRLKLTHTLNLACNNA